MRYTIMTYNFDYYSGDDLICPKKPIKPSLSRNPSAAEARDYADDLEYYETAMEEYKTNITFYMQTLNNRRLELQTKLRDDYAITEAQMFILWGKAWEDGHLEGVRRVVEIFDELYNIASEFAALEKN